MSLSHHRDSLDSPLPLLALIPSPDCLVLESSRLVASKHVIVGLRRPLPTVLLHLPWLSSCTCTYAYVVPSWRLILGFDKSNLDRLAYLRVRAEAPREAETRPMADGPIASRAFTLMMADRDRGRAKTDRQTDRQASKVNIWHAASAQRFDMRCYEETVRS